MAEVIFERILRCRFCRREMNCSPLTYEQNPFCTVCLRERVGNLTPRSGVRWRREGNYFIMEDAEIQPSDARARHPS